MCTSLFQTAPSGNVTHQSFRKKGATPFNLAFQSCYESRSIGYICYCTTSTGFAVIFSWAFYSHARRQINLIKELKNYTVFIHNFLLPPFFFFTSSSFLLFKRWEEWGKERQKCSNSLPVVKIWVNALQSKSLKDLTFRGQRKSRLIAEDMVVKRRESSQNQYFRHISLCSCMFVHFNAHEEHAFFTYE